MELIRGKFFSFIFLVHALSLTYLAASTVPARPNIIFILADDLGWADVSWNDPKILSPNLHALYNDSLILKNYYMQSVCTPSRAAILTGHYPFRLGLQHGAAPEMLPEYIPLDVPTLPEKLRELGYATHAVGKWHLGFCDIRVTPTRRGFDSFYGFWLGSEDYYKHTKGIPEIEKPGLDFRNNECVVRDQDGIYSVYSHTARAVKIIEEHDKSKPLFLYLPYQAVHGPNQVPTKYINMYKTRIAPNEKERTIKAAMVTVLDEGIKNITGALKKNGLYNNSILIFSSDNGGEVTTASFNFPYRGSKNSLYEGGTKVVGFIHGSMLPKGNFKGLFHAVDWFPTLLRAAGSIIGGTPDGINQWDNLLTNQTSRTEMVYGIDEVSGVGAIRTMTHKLILGRQIGLDGWYWNMSSVAAVQNTAKLASVRKVPGFPRPDTHGAMLFDLILDPYEKDDCSDLRPDLVESLYAKLAEYKNEILSAFPLTLDESADPKYYNYTWSAGWCTADRSIIPTSPSVQKKGLKKKYVD